MFGNDEKKFADTTLEYKKTYEREQRQLLADAEFQAWVAAKQGKALQQREVYKLADGHGNMVPADALLESMANEAWQGKEAAAYNDMRYFLTSMVTLTITLVKVYNKQFNDALLDGLGGLADSVSIPCASLIHGIRNSKVGYGVSKAAEELLTKLNPFADAADKTLAPAMMYSISFDDSTKKLNFGQLTSAKGTPFTNQPELNAALQQQYEKFVKSWLTANGYKPDPANPDGYVDKAGKVLDKTAFETLLNDKAYGLEAFYKIGAGKEKKLGAELHAAPTHRP